MLAVSVVKFWASMPSRLWSSSFLLVLLALAGSLTSCQPGPGSQPTVGSESHFLTSCVDHCDGGLECLCGVCTKSCADASTCTALGASAECIALDQRPPKAACSASVAAFCDVSCDADQDCAAVSPEHRCRNGFCRAKGDDLPEARDGRVELNEVCSVYLNDLCVALTSCNDFPYCSVADCKAERDCSDFSVLSDAIGAGRTSFDPVAMYECHRRFIEAPCGFGFFLFVPGLIEAVDHCGDVLKGSGQDAAPCGSDTECAPGFGCVSSTCPATCRPLGKEGEPCLTDTTPGCDPAFDLTCYSSICRKPWQLGDRCAQASDCGGELNCDLAKGACVERSDLGEPCDMSVKLAPFCKQGLWCNAWFALGECRPEGEGCFGDGDCPKDLACLGADLLEPMPGNCLPKGQLGEPCESLNGCQQGFRCSTPGNVCVPRGELGDACIENTDGQCADGLFCDASTCRRIACLSASCGADDYCYGASCVDGTCVPWAKLGEPCSESGDCFSANCRNGACADTTSCQ